MGKEKLKYSRHPQKFENPDPKLQKEWEDLKEVLCDNEYMMGYKIMVGQPISIPTIWNIITTVHTDTSNIYSHLLFGFFFLFRAYGQINRLVFMNCMCALTFFMSAFYHTFRNYSRKMYNMCLCFDVSAIGIQIFTFNLVDIVTYFEESRPDLLKIYMMILASFFIITMVSMPFILHYKIYWLRTFLYIILATTCFPLAFHAYIVNGMTEKMKSMIYLRLMTFFFQGVGLCFRSSHIPERFAQGTIFQYVLHSHFWFHIFGSIGSYYGCLSSEALI